MNKNLSSNEAESKFWTAFWKAFASQNSIFGYWVGYLFGASILDEFFDRFFGKNGEEISYNTKSSLVILVRKKNPCVRQIFSNLMPFTKKFRKNEDFFNNL